MDKLPFEILRDTILSMNLREVVNLYNALANNNGEDIPSRYSIILEERLSLFTFLRRLSCIPDKLLDAMDKHHCIIYGNNVVPYFFPGITPPSEPWRITCPRNNMVGFINDTVNTGMRWNVSSDKLDGKFISTTHGTSSNFKGEDVAIKLETRWTDNTVIQILRCCPTSISQCFITSSVACHMYYTRVETDENVIWSANPRIPDIIYDTNLVPCSQYCILKCVEGISRTHGSSDYFLPLKEMTYNAILSRVRTDLVEHKDPLKYLVELSYSDVKSAVSSSVSPGETIDLVIRRCTCLDTSGLNEITQYLDSCIKFSDDIGFVNDTRDVRYLGDNQAYYYGHDCTPSLSDTGKVLLDKEIVGCENDDGQYLPLCWDESHNRIVFV